MLTPKLKEKITTEDGAIDLASIMVGIIVIGIIGGIIAATIFAIIPWAQDNAAKANLSSLQQAENTYAGFAADTNSGGSGKAPNFGTSDNLDAKGLIKTGTTLKVQLGSDSTCYIATATSSSGKIFWYDSTTKKTQLYTNSSSADCNGTDLATITPVDPTVGLMVFNLSATAACQNITLPLNGTVSAQVNWGDGTSRTPATGSNTVNHVYSAAATHTVTITGDFSSWGGSYWDSASCVTSVDQWHNTKTTNASYGFGKATNLTDIKEIPSTITDLSYFVAKSTYNGTSTNTWNVSNVRNFTSTFAEDATFNQPLNNWTVKNAQSLNGTFQFASAFNQDLSSWDTHNVTDLNGTFYFASSFNNNVNNWNTAKVTNLDNTFMGATVFNQPLNNWNTANATSTGSTFNKATAFNQPLSNWDIGKSTNTSFMFSEAQNFNQPIGTWNTTSVTDMTYMFNGARSFNQDISKWNTVNVVNMSFMFDNAVNLSSDLSQWKTGNVTTMESMFYNNASLTADLSKWDTSNVNNMNYMFAYTTNFDANLSGWNVSKITSATRHSYFNLNSGISTAHLPKFTV